jgi:hypothetical protein
MKKLILTAFAATLFCIGSMAQDTTSINNNLRQGVEDAEDAGNEVKEDAQDAGMDANASAQPAEIEVMEDKEGPNNQVIYKYQGGLYYVDREQKALVKIEESQLKDAEHQAVISSSLKEEDQ